MNAMTHVFPDTNIFLHYPPLSNIDWQALCNCKHVHLVVCLQVIHELDSKKSDSRLASRAERAIKEIREAHRTGATIRDNVKLSLFNHELRHSEFAETLSPDSGDDKIVHHVRAYREHHPEHDVALATEDFGMELRCEAGGVRVIRMDSALRLENPQDELSKKHKQAVQELAALKNRLPRLTVGIVQRGEAPVAGHPPEFKVNDGWQALDVDAEIEKQQRQYPKQAGRHARPTASQHTQSLGELISGWSEMSRFISEEDWEEYDTELDDYFDDYRKYVQAVNHLESVKSRCITFDLILQNGGNGLATDIDVIVVCPAAVHGLFASQSKEAKLLEEPRTPPKPPETPRPSDFRQELNRLKHSAWARSVVPDLRFMHRGDEFTPLAQLVKSPEGIWEIHVRLQKLKHGHTANLGTFFAVFQSWKEARPFSVLFAISASELTEKMEGTLSVIVRLASETY